ncbi:TPA: hypothetical protein ACOEHI_003844 [Enterobacter kobei]
MDIFEHIEKASDVKQLTSQLTDATLQGAGRTAIVCTYAGDQVKTAFKAIEASNLIVSNMTDGRINPNFPAELQPRDRTSLASTLQVRNLANELNPQRLADSELSSTGAPIIGHDNVVESGNGRTMAIFKAYAEGKAEHYRQFVIDNADLFGLKSTDIEALQHPVLVRIRLDDVDRVKFARDSNTSALLLESKGTSSIAKLNKFISSASSVEEIAALISYFDDQFVFSDNAEALGRVLGKKLQSVVASGDVKEQKELRSLSKFLFGSSLKTALIKTDAYMICRGLKEIISEIGNPSAHLIIEQLLIDGSVLLINKKLEELHTANEADRELIKKELKIIIDKFLEKTGKYSRFSEAQKNTLSYLSSGKITNMAEYIELTMSAREKAAKEEPLANPKKAMMDDHNVGQQLFGSEKLEHEISTAKNNIKSLADSSYFSAMGSMRDAERTAWVESLQEGIVGYGPTDGNKQLGLAWYLTKLDGYERSDIEGGLRTALEPLKMKVESIKQELISQSLVDDTQVTDWISSIKIASAFRKHPQIYNLLVQDLKEIYRICQGRIFTLKEIAVTKSGRGYAQKSKGLIALSEKYNSRVLWHECGHHFEYSNPNLLAKAVEFLKMKADENNTVMRLNHLTNLFFDSKEIAIADHFSQPYIGKIYSQGSIEESRSTEIFSSGLEYLYESQFGAKSLLNDDLLLQFVVGAIKGYSS